MGEGDGEGGGMRKAVISSSVIAAALTLLGGIYTNARLEGQKNEFSKDLEKYKVELQNTNAQLEAARASYIALDARMNEFEVALSRYVNASALSLQYPGSKDLSLTAAQWYNDLSDRMGDVVEAVGGQGIEPSLSTEVDVVLKPISQNLEAVQKSPQVNPIAIKQYNESWKKAIEELKGKIRAAKGKLIVTTT